MVNDSEVLLREMFEPYHFQGDVLQKTAVSLGELRSTGFSVHRKEHVTYEHVRNAIDERFSRSKKGAAWKSEGVAVILTSDARNLVDSDQNRLCVVIDTALKENPGHASIYGC